MFKKKYVYSEHPQKTMILEEDEKRHVLQLHDLYFKQLENQHMVKRNREKLTQTFSSFIYIIHLFFT